MASSKKSAKKQGIVVDIPRDIWELTKEDKAKLRRAFGEALVEVRAQSSEDGDEEGDLTPIIENS
jgi:hypothetical protein